MNECTILVTGGTGFVGRLLCRRLAEEGYQVRMAVRKATVVPHENCCSYVTGDLNCFAGWRALVHGVESVVHLVARTHITDEFHAAAMAAYRATNVDVTRRLAAAAKQAGVRRFIYLSSIKAVANASSAPLVEASPCRPVDSYGITKLAAEQTLRRQLLGSGTTYTILRPPLVYGPGVQGNFLRLLQLVQRGIPLPRIHNRRSMIHVENLVDVIERCLKHSAAMDQTFHVADQSPISTADLIRHMAQGSGQSARLLPLPQFLLRQFGKALGKGQEVRRLVDSLVVSNETVRKRLHWKPRIDTPTGIERTSLAFVQAPWSSPSKRQADSENSRAA